MEATVEIRYETLLDVVRQMPPSQMERLLTDVRRLLESRLAAQEVSPAKYRREVVDAARRLEAGDGVPMTPDEVQQLIKT